MSSPAAEKPNLIVLVSTDHSAALTGFQGGMEGVTPNLDALAAAGTVFGKAYSCTPWFGPGRAALLTGKLEHRSGNRIGKEAFPLRLKQAGYTLGFAGDWLPSLESGLAEEEWKAAFDAWAATDRSNKQPHQTAGHASLTKWAGQFPDTSRALGAWGAEFVKEKATGGQPFCLIVFFKAPHVPRVAANPEDAAAFAEREFPYPANYGFAEGGSPLPPLQMQMTRQWLGGATWRPDRFQHEMRGAAALVRGLDAGVGLISQALQASGVADRTVVLFASSNGHFAGNHGLDDKMLPFEEAARVPLVIHDPRVPKAERASRSQALVATVDVAATAAEVAGLPELPGQDGKSLLPMLASAEAKGHPHLPLCQVSFSDTGTDFGRVMGVTDGRHKYLFWPYGDAWTAPAEQLFDLENDPGELSNLAGKPEHAELLETMRGLYDRELERWKTEGESPMARRWAALGDRHMPWTQKTWIRELKGAATPSKAKQWEAMKAAYRLRTGVEMEANEALTDASKPAERPTVVAPDPNVPGLDYWAVEDAEARARLPEFKTIPAAPLEELTPASRPFDRAEHLDWERSHGDAASIRYSAHDQINRGNVAKLEVVSDFRAWKTLPKNEARATQSTQGNPIFVGDLVITHTSNGDLVGLDPLRGESVWRLRAADLLEPGGVTGWRGFAYWKGNGDHPPAVFFGYARWIGAVDPKTGIPVESFGKKGFVEIEKADFRVAGAIFGETFVVPSMDGKITGLHCGTGEIQWVFNLSPGPGEYGYDTWDQFGYEPGTRIRTGVSCWGGMALDEERGIAYFSTSSPKPNYVGAQHRGQNLFSNCVVAVDARTGKRVWHFQELRHDIWDMEPAAPPMLVSFDFEGKRIDAVAQVTKMGNTLLLDRLTGRPVHDFRLRRAPTSDVPGELTWPYQPFLELPEPFYDQEFTEEDITDLTPEANAFVKAQIASGKVRLGWMEPPGINHHSVSQLYGGVNWPGGCFDPETGLLYIGVNHTPTLARIRALSFEKPTPEKWGSELKLYQTYCIACHGPDYQGVGVAPGLVGLAGKYPSAADMAKLIMEGRGGMPPLGAAIGQEATDSLVHFVREGLALKDDPASREPRPRYGGFSYEQFYDDRGYPASKPPWGTLTAIHLASGKIRFEVPLGEYKELTAEGVPKTGTKNFGGPIVTAGGLVFCAGTQDRMIRAFDKDTGEELWKHELPFAAFAAPSTQIVNRRQVIVINASATSHGFVSRHPGLARGDAVVVFALPEGTASHAPSQP